jgi:ABC-2 type transport system ATP-binding protein
MTAATPPDVVLRTVGLTKRYGSLTAVRDLHLEVPRGRVYGFLGPNGAGKTTTIAMLVGLIAPTDGYAEVLGFDSRTELPDALRRVGTILEGQAYYPLLSGRDNLRVWAALCDVRSPSRIDEMLELVGLGGRADDRVNTYSQGMKQRLGLAGALLHDPELLILDEPTNGLDPAGIREFRDLIRRLPHQGKTVFISSHLLGEVELICDDVGIVKEGRLITQGPVEALLRRGATLEMRVTDVAKAVDVLRAIDWVDDVTPDGDRLVVQAPSKRAADLSKALAQHEVYLAELRPRDSTLEDFFLEVTGDAGAEP